MVSTATDKHCVTHKQTLFQMKELALGSVKYFFVKRYDDSESSPRKSEVVVVRVEPRHLRSKGARYLK